MSEQNLLKMESAYSAMRDILFMYKVLTDYKGLFDDFGTEDGKFDPMTYVDCKASELCIEESDIKLLQEGSVIKILCGVLQSWGQGGHPDKKCFWVSNAKLLLRDGRLNHVPYLKEALITCIESESRFNKIYAQAVYKKYVLGCFKTLSET